MARRLPPLNALRAFEAAARHLSFTRAADELNVTQAAVSHHVKTLEEQIGLPLFRRLSRGLILTDEGQTLFPAVRHAFDTLAEAVDRIAQHSRPAKGFRPPSRRRRPRRRGVSGQPLPVRPGRRPPCR